MVDGQCLHLRDEAGECAQWDLCTTGPDHEYLGQRCRIVLELGLDFENELVLAGRGVEVRDLALAARVVQRLGDQRGRDAHAGRGIAIDLDCEVGCGYLQIGGDILKFGHLLHRLLDDRCPMIELLYIRVGQRVLIERAAEPPADTDVLPGLHVEFDPFDFGYFGSQALNDLVGGQIPLIMWLQLDEHASGVLGRVVGTGTGKRKYSGNSGVILYDVDNLVGELLHARKRYVLSRIGLAKNEAGVLLGEKALWDRNVKVACRRHQNQGRQESRELMAKDETEATVVGAQHPLEAALGDPVETTPAVQRLLL